MKFLLSTIMKEKFILVKTQSLAAAADAVSLRAKWVLFGKKKDRFEQMKRSIYYLL